MNRKLLTFIFYLSLVLVAAYYMVYQNVVVAKDDVQQPQAMPVSMEVVEESSVPLTFSFSGRVVAVNHAQIHPQVSGEIAEIRFDEGQEVQKGDVLFVIDPKPYRAALDVAEAELNAAKTQMSLAYRDYARAADLVKSQAVSKKLFDERKNAYLMAKAAKESAEARVQQAELNYEYAFVKAPFAGKTSRAEVTIGNVVNSGMSAPLLTSIVSNEGVYVDFNLDEATYINYIKPQLDANKDVPVHVIMPNDVVILGELYHVDNHIDVTTGTIRARALFEGKQPLLVPGMFAEVEVASAGEDALILVTEKAIGTDQNRKFVWIVNDQNMTEYRMVTLGKTVDGKRVILTGLQPGETIVTAGILKIRPGTLVQPKAEE